MLTIEIFENSEEYIFNVSVEKLQNIIDPFISSPWGDGRIKKQNVENDIKNNNLESNYFNNENYYPEWHTRRIAYLVVNLDKTPITILINKNNFDDYDVDGYHRLAAAIYRGDKNINVYTNVNRKLFNKWLNNY